MNRIRNLKRVVCGVSGGVDSSVAALLLKKEGYDVVGAFMKNWDGKDEFGFCQADKDAEDAHQTCKALGIPFVEVNFVKEYWNYVFESLIQDYKEGLTPNPDIMCNYHIKFDSFFDYAKDRLDADYFATGHYARVQHITNPQTSDIQGAKLLTARDTFKDQTFFLSHINQRALKQTLFPLGDFLKNQVRKMASEAGLHHVANRPDSTGICFVGKRNFQEFISEYIQHRPGPFVDIDTGEEVGQHQGIHMWTLGQRCRLGGHLKPYFVAKKHPESRTIFVALGTDHPTLFSNTFVTGPPHWIRVTPTPLKESGQFNCLFRFQHTKPLTGAQITYNPSGLKVTLEKPMRALTPGQYAVFYSDGECLGCARIIHNHSSDEEEVPSSFPLSST